MTSSPNTKVATVVSKPQEMFRVASIPIGTATLVVPAATSDRTMGIYLQNETGVDALIRPTATASTAVQITLRPLAQPGSTIVIPGNGAVYVSASSATVEVSGYTA